MNLSDKIRNYRKRSKLSQLDLENAIEASPGSISRIESGKVNPTKETIKEISAALELSASELADLLEITPLFPAKDEIDKAKNEVQNYLLSNNRLAILIDEWGFLYAASIGIRKLFHISDEVLPLVYGKNMIELLLDPKFGVRKFIPEDMIYKSIAISIKRLAINSNGNDIEFLNAYEQLEGFDKVLELVEMIDEKEVFDPKNKKIDILVDSKSITFQISREHLKTNKRFELVEYYQ